jgi:hypothetical protein
MFGLAAVAALVAMAFVGASAATAESTALCKEDTKDLVGEVCPVGQRIAHLHETTLSGTKAKILTSTVNPECDVLFLGVVTSGNNLGSPLLMNGQFTYTNCTSGCTVAELGGPGEIKVLKSGHETASVTGEWFVTVECGVFIDCTYEGRTLLGTGKGPLLSTETNGEVKIQDQILPKVAGTCPVTTKLDIVLTPLTDNPTYIGK